jgi:hypothetical protein
MLGLPPRGEPLPKVTGQKVVAQGSKKEVQIRPAQPAEWVNSRRASVQQDAVRVRVTSATVKPVPFKDGTTGASKLVIGVRLINARGATRLAYESWSAKPTRVKTGDWVRLRDDQGRVYHLTALDPRRPVAGQVLQAPLRPGKPVTDVLVFEPPTGPVRFLRLELSTAAFGQPGKLRLEVPGSMLEGDVP